MNREEAIETAKKVSSFVNVMGHDNNAFLETMANEHRTLQQAFTRLCLQWIEHMASQPDNRIDLRNQASRDVCRALVFNTESADEFGGSPSSYLPTV